MLFEVSAQTVCDTISAQEFFKKIEKIENVKDIKINSFMMSLARMTAKGPTKDLLNQIKSMRMFGLTECSDSDKIAFAEYVSSVEIKDFDKVEDVSKEDVRSIVFISYKDDYIQEVLVATLGEEIYGLISMKGELTEEMLLRMSKGEFAPPQ